MLPHKQSKVKIPYFYGILCGCCILILGQSLFALRQISTPKPVLKFHSRNQQQKQTKKLAFAISLTKDGNFADGAAVLAKSIQLHHPELDYDLVAIVHPDASSAIPFLQKLQFKTVTTPVPVDISEIHAPYYKKALPKSGCCGEAEFIKLEIFRLFSYSRVIFLDTDMIFTGYAPEVIHTDKQMLFSYDRTMGDFGKVIPCIQGGFLVIKPSLSTYNVLLNTIRKGDFRRGTGWGGTMYGWCYGGQTIQGIMSYYANVLAPANTTQEVDACRVDGMSSNKNRNGEECSKVDAKSVKLFHFTACQKPWSCVSPHSHLEEQKTLCDKMHDRWWKYRQLMEMDLLGTKTTREIACKDGYKNIFVRKQPAIPKK